jgi:YcxB-like protein
MLKPRMLIAVAVLIGASIFFLTVRGGMEYVGYSILVFLTIVPISLYLGLKRVVDGKSQLTDLKTLEFGPSHLVVTGPDWKSETPWTQFKGFSEDDTYFYLHLNRTGIATVIPKSAFSSEQQRIFREYGQRRNA